MNRSLNMVILSGKVLSVGQDPDGGLIESNEGKVYRFGSAAYKDTTLCPGVLVSFEDAGNGCARNLEILQVRSTPGRFSLVPTRMKYLVTTAVLILLLALISAVRGYL